LNSFVQSVGPTVVTVAVATSVFTCKPGRDANAVLIALAAWSENALPEISASVPVIFALPLPNRDNSFNRELAVLPNSGGAPGLTWVLSTMRSVGNMRLAAASIVWRVAWSGSEPESVSVSALPSLTAVNA
jgi:hypothetical protein